MFHAEITLELGKYRHLICVKVKYYIIVLRFNHFSLTVKPLLRGHLWDKEKVWPYKTGVCIIDMTTWAGLTIVIACDNGSVGEVYEETNSNSVVKN